MMMTPDKHISGRKDRAHGGRKSGAEMLASRKCTGNPHFGRQHITWAPLQLWISVLLCSVMLAQRCRTWLISAVKRQEPFHGLRDSKPLLSAWAFLASKQYLKSIPKQIPQETPARIHECVHRKQGKKSYAPRVTLLGWGREIPC